MTTTHGTAFEFAAAPKSPTGVLIVPLAARPQPPLESVAAVDAVCDDAVSELVAAGALGSEVGQLAHTTRAGGYRRVLVVSLGDSAKLEPQLVRKAAASAARWLIGEKLAAATLWLENLAALGVEDAPAEWAMGMALAGYRFDQYRQTDKATPRRIRVGLLARESGRVQRTLPTIRTAATIAAAVNYSRQLAQQPGNVIQPQSLAAEARAVARRHKLTCTVLDAAKLAKLGMAGLLAVGRGAEHAPCLIRLDYRGARGARNNTVIVGKALTFDTGGYSIKPSAGLAGLKYDKSGGCAVLGVLQAAATLKLKCNVTGLIGAAENMVSARAYRPGDILKMASGKTVEVTNTDAEGRLVLADALWYAQEHCRPTALIDIATLTGGARIALGTAAAGLMSNDDELSAALGECGRRTHERLWRLPLWDDFRDLIKGNDTDIVNSPDKREALCIVGGVFLREFVRDQVPWAHIDIAAVATEDSGPQKGATGFGVRLLVEYLRRSPA
jgi:leucyl aminopeptidase